MNVMNWQCRRVSHKRGKALIFSPLDVYKETSYRASIAITHQLSMYVVFMYTLRNDSTQLLVTYMLN